MQKRVVAKQQEALEKIDKQIEVENDLKVNLNKQISEADAELEKVKMDLIQKEKLLANRQKTLNEHVGNIRNYESEKKIKYERLKFLNDKSDSLKEQLSQDKQSLERTTFSIQSLTQEKESASKLLQEIQLTIESFQSELEEQKLKTNSLESEYTGLDKQYREGKDELYSKTKELEIKEIQLNSFKAELEKTTSDSSEKNRQPG